MPDYEHPLLLDTEARSGSVSIFDRNTIVIAGAGTGKTTLLIGRMIFWLLGEFWQRYAKSGASERSASAAVQSIAAITFTEKAAGEMADRLSETLLTISTPAKLAADKLLQSLINQLLAQYGLPYAELKKRTDLILARSERLEINTIHGFCAGILREKATAADLSPEFAIDEDSSLKNEIFERHWDHFIREALDRREIGPDWELLLREGAVAAYQTFFALLAEHGISIDPGNERQFADLLGNPEVRLQQLLEDIQQLMPLLELIVATAKRLRTAPKLIEQLFRPIERAGAASDPLAAMQALAADEQLSSYWSKSSDVRKAFLDSKDLKKLDQQLLSSVEVLIERTMVNSKFLGSYNQNRSFWSALFNVATPFVTQVREEWRRSGVVSFSDLLVETADLLRRDRGVRASLKQRYRQVLVDELQDTDPVQSLIVSYLCEQEEVCADRPTEVQLEAGKLFVVGDPKQSIYGFRNADLRAFEWLTEHTARQGAATFDLQTNFRSTANVIACSNQVFEQAMSEARYIQPRYIPIVPRPQATAGPHVELWIPVGGDGDALVVKSDDATTIEASAIADFIRTEVEAGHNAWRDFAILLRAMPPASSYMDALEVLDIPYVVQGDKDYYKRQEVLDCLNLMNCILDPLDSPAFIGLLKSPLVAMPEEAVLVIADAGIHTSWWQGELETSLAKVQDYLKADWGPGFVSTLRALRLLRESFGTLNAKQWLEQVVRLFALPEIYGLRYLGERRTANVRKFLNGLQNALSDYNIRLQTWLRKQTTAHLQAREEGEGVLADENLNAVRILTVHQAKGLEFPVVFCANQHRGPARFTESACAVHRMWTEQGGDFSLKFNERTTDRYQDHCTMIQRREDAERIRVGYVAYTRAKQKLIISGAIAGYNRVFAQDKANAITLMSPFYANLLDKIPNTDELGYVKDSDPDARPQWLQIRLLPASKWLALERLSRKQDTALELDIKEYVSSWVSNYDRAAATMNVEPIVSPSQLQDEEREDLSVVAAREEADEPAQVEESQHERCGRHIGSLCHEVMELLDFAHPAETLAAVRAALRTTLPAKLVRAEDVEFVDDEVRVIMQNFFLSEIFARLRLARIIGREIPFLMPYCGEDSAAVHTVNGVIDLIYEEAGQIVVADYKSDRVRSEAEMKAKLRTYSQQARFYTRAVKEALGLTKEPAFELIFLRCGQARRK